MNDYSTVTLSRDTFDTIQDNAEAIAALADMLETLMFDHFGLVENERLLDDKSPCLGTILAIKQLAEPIVCSA